MNGSDKKYLHNARLAEVYETINTAVQAVLATELLTEGHSLPDGVQEGELEGMVSIPVAVRASPVDLVDHYRTYGSLAGAPLPHVGAAGRQELEILLGYGARALAKYMFRDAHTDCQTDDPTRDHARFNRKVCPLKFRTGRRRLPLFERRDLEELGLSDNRVRAREGN